MKVMPISPTRIYASRNNQLDCARLPQSRDTISFSGSTFQRSTGRSNTIAKVQRDLGKAIKENNTKKILEYFGVKCEVNENNLLTISHYIPYVSYFKEGQNEEIGGSLSFSELGINENNLFKKISVIEGSAYFGDTEVTNLGELKKIGGAAHFENSKITNLGNLESVGPAYFANSQVRELGNLKYIRHDAHFENSNIVNLGKLEYIGQNAFFSGSKMTSLGNLETIGQKAVFYDSNITDLGKLKSIGSDAIFSGSKITNLGNLEVIGGSARFWSSEVVNLGALKTIGGHAWFDGTKITDLGNLETVGHTLDLSNTEITSLGKLKSVGNKLPDMHKLCIGLPPPFVIRLNEHINPKDAERLIVGKKTHQNITSIKTNKKITTNNPQIQKPDGKIEQPQKEMIEKTSFLQRLKNTLKTLIGN